VKARSVAIQFEVRIATAPSVTVPIAEILIVAIQSAKARSVAIQFEVRNAVSLTWATPTAVFLASALNAASRTAVFQIGFRVVTRAAPTSVPI
jgi:hypothetical protein